MRQASNRLSMSAPDVFTAGLDVVIEALQTRVLAGGDLKALSSQLNGLIAVASASPVASASEHTVQTTESPSRIANSSAGSSNARPSVKAPRKLEFVFPLVPSASENGTREERLFSLRTAALACTKCEHLASTRNHVVCGEGAPDAKLMFVAEAPGLEEDKQGIPFAGEAGALLDKMVQAMGLSRQQVYLTSVLKCRPDVPGDETGSRPPTPAEMSNCAPFLAAQISIIQPQVIVALGAGAMRALFGSTETVGKLRSHWHELQGIPVMPTFHPSYLIRNQSNSEKCKVWEDLLQVMEKLGCEVSDKQRGFFKPRASA